MFGMNASTSGTLCMLLGLLCLSSLGCPKTTPEPSASEPQGTSVLLQVVDAQGNPVPEAIISSRNALFSVDGSGHRLFENLPPGRFFARVDARGFTSATSVLELRDGAHVGTQVRLLPRPAPLPFQAEQGGILQTEQVRLSLPPNAVVDSLGQPVTGPVEATIVPLDPTFQLPFAPGPLEAVTSADGEAVALESIFMAEVNLWRGTAPLQLAPGKSATLEFLIPEALARPFKAGDSMPTWWFDLDEGLWREEGTGTFQPSQTQPGRLAWTATVNHFTTWNVDKPIRKTVLSCVNVRRPRDSRAVQSGDGYLERHGLLRGGSHRAHGDAAARRQGAGREQLQHQCHCRDGRGVYALIFRSEPGSHETEDRRLPSRE